MACPWGQTRTPSILQSTTRCLLWLPGRAHHRAVGCAWGTAPLAASGLPSPRGSGPWLGGHVGLPPPDGDPGAHHPEREAGWASDLQPRPLRALSAPKVKPRSPSEGQHPWAPCCSHGCPRRGDAENLPRPAARKGELPQGDRLILTIYKRLSPGTAGSPNPSQRYVCQYQLREARGWLKTDAGPVNSKILGWKQGSGLGTGQVAGGQPAVWWGGSLCGPCALPLARSVEKQLRGAEAVNSEVRGACCPHGLSACACETGCRGPGACSWCPCSRCLQGTAPRTAVRPGRSPRTLAWPSLPLLPCAPVSLPPPRTWFRKVSPVGTACRRAPARLLSL